MTDALSKVSRTAETGKKGSRDSVFKQAKPGTWKHTVSEEDRVDISKEARDKAGHGNRKGLLEYLENED